MKTPAQADIQRWSDEIARDPRSLAFLPLARAYRRQGLRDLALQLCLRGLEAYPSHVDAHGLLAVLYLETGDHERAADEWSMVLRIDPDNFDALRGLGFCYLEQDRLSKARQSLERAALLRPTDATVKEALHVLGTRQELATQRAVAGSGDDPWAEAPESPEASKPPAAEPVPAGSQQPSQPAAEPPAAAAEPPAAAAATAAAGTAAAPPPPGMPSDPSQLFDELLGTGPLLGGLLVDPQGMVLAGRLTDAVAGDAAQLGAVLGGAVGEAARTVAHLQLGAWRGILLESDHALLHLSPAAGGAVVILAAQRNTPAGWVVRAAAQAVDQAGRYAEAYG